MSAGRANIAQGSAQSSQLLQPESHVRWRRNLIDDLVQTLLRSKCISRPTWLVATANVQINWRAGTPLDRQNSARRRVRFKGIDGGHDGAVRWLRQFDRRQPQRISITLDNRIEELTPRLWAARFGKDPMRADLAKINQ